MYWADRLVEKLDKNKKHRVDDQSTPSGHYHVGSLRAVATHALIFESMGDHGLTSDFTYVFNDIDPMDGLPVYLDKQEYGQHMGKPLCYIPAPDGKSESFARQYGDEFVEAFGKLGFTPQIFWTSEMYKKGDFDVYIQKTLDQVETIRKIYLQVAKQRKPDGWYPVQVICPQCKKIGSTLVTGWDGSLVDFECKVDLVDWSVGCGHTGKISPFGGNAKLNWKVEWPASWPALGVTVEGAGKDHMSAGGSHDIGVEITQKVFGYDAPFSFMSEFFLIGGAKMSSSKGKGMSAKDFFSVLPPVLARFLLVRTPYQRAINFNPSISDTIPDLFDEYDRCAKEWYKVGDDNPMGRMFQASQIDDKLSSEKQVYFPRFRDVAKVIQFPSVDEQKHFEDLKGSALTTIEKEILKERMSYAKNWLEKYADEKEKFEFKKELPSLNLSEAQKTFVGNVSQTLKEMSDVSGEIVQTKIFELTKQSNIDPKDAFPALYKAIYDKNHGPKLGWVLAELDKNTLIERLDLAATSTQGDTDVSISKSINSIDGGYVLNVSDFVQKKWPTLSAGVAVIKGVSIANTDEGLENQKDKMVKRIKAIQLEELANDSVLSSYRKLFKEFGVDWHSRRPSPEALLRRIIQGKPLYTINTCVDAGNVIVLDHHISLGLFDADKLEFPTRLDLAEGGEEISLLGDTEPTKIKDGELCYFDQKGAYNLDFNYRDADRTKVTTGTKNLVINVEGVYDISPREVEKVLDESIEIIMKYCGGKLVHKRMIT